MSRKRQAERNAKQSARPTLPPCQRRDLTGRKHMNCRAGVSIDGFGLNPLSGIVSLRPNGGVTAIHKLIESQSSLGDRFISARLHAGLQGVHGQALIPSRRSRRFGVSYVRHSQPISTLSIPSRRSRRFSVPRPEHGPEGEPVSIPPRRSRRFGELRGKDAEQANCVSIPSRRSRRFGCLSQTLSQLRVRLNPLSEIASFRLSRACRAGTSTRRLNPLSEIASFRVTVPCS